ncbi:MAG: glycoside hydrolase family 28 protein [Verrucomicrobiota bacterium]
MTYNISKYGAVGDGATVNTQAIQAAIDACAQAGGGRVTVTGGAYVTGTIFLKNRVHLEIAPGAELRGSANIADYAAGCGKNMYRGEPQMDHCLIFADGAEGIGISGGGTINGNGAAFPNPDDADRNRPMMIRFRDCTNLRLRDVTLRDPAAWTSAWLYCTDIVVDGITIHSRVNANGDGLDFDGCRDVRVANCAFDTSDDSICLQTSRPDAPCRDVTVTNCLFRSKWAGMRIGLLSRGDIENICVSNCVFRDISDAGLKIQMCEGASMQNMTFANLFMQNVPRPVFMTLGQQRCCVDAPPELAPPGQLRQLMFSTLLVDNRNCGPDSQIVLTGIPGALIEDVTLHNVRMTTRGGGTETDARRDGVPELVPETLAGHWPEYRCFGRPLPASGLYARHVRNLTCRELNFDTIENDCRDEIVTEDVVP